MVSLGPVTSDELVSVPYRKQLRTEFSRAVKWIPQGANREETQAAWQKNDSTQVAEKWIIETTLTAARLLPLSYGISHHGGYPERISEALIEVYLIDPDTNRALIQRNSCSWDDGETMLLRIHQHWIDEIGKSFG